MTIRWTKKKQWWWQWTTYDTKKEKMTSTIIHVQTGMPRRITTTISNAIGANMMAMDAMINKQHRHDKNKQAWQWRWSPCTENCKQQTASNTEDDINKTLNHLQNSKQQKERNMFWQNTTVITMQQSAWTLDDYLPTMRCSILPMETIPTAALLLQRIGKKWDSNIKSNNTNRWQLDNSNTTRWTNQKNKHKHCCK